MKKNAILTIALLLAAVASAEPYTRLFKIINPQGTCLIKRPGGTEFEEAHRDKAYPFGSVVSCGKDASAVLLFSEADAVKIMSESSAEMTLSKDEKESRVVSLLSGTALTRINATTTNDFVVISTPAGTVRSIIGNCKVTVTSKPATKIEPETIDVELRAEPASRMKFVGRQFIIPVLKNGFGARISSYADDSYTYLSDLLGDYSVYVNTGLDPDPPEPLEDNSNLSPVKLSTKAALRIWRERAAIGDTLVVAILATTPAGKGRESFAFAVGKSDIAARSNVFLDTITNELAIAEMSKDADGDDGQSDDGFGDLYGSNDLGGDFSSQDSSADSTQAGSGEDSLDDYLF